MSENVDCNVFDHKNFKHIITRKDYGFESVRNKELKGGSLLCCKKDCNQNREEDSFFCMNHNINSISNDKQQSYDFLFN